MHSRIDQTIRTRDAETAGRAMHAHLLQASDYQSREPMEAAAPRTRSGNGSSSRRARVRRGQASH